MPRQGLRWGIVGVIVIALAIIALSDLGSTNVIVGYVLPLLVGAAVLAAGVVVLDKWSG